jgi:hypothetical protein
MPELLVQQVLQAVQSRSWIRRVKHQVVGKVGGEQRLLGANNMKIGWHIHPYGQEVTHVPSQPVSIEAFFHLLEQALSERGKLG